MTRRSCRLVGVALAALAQGNCEPPPAPVQTPAPVVAVEAPPRADDCRRDIPDCSAACALRETNQLDYIDWYDRRCAAVILGKNPDKVAGVEPPDAGHPSNADRRPDDLSDNPYR